MADGASSAALRRALLRWYDREARDLPWRRRRTPWRVWVSEVMLQQTRVEAVVEPYRRFLATFPSLASLARAHERDVLAAWSGLGYYRRARLLHAGARHVREHCGGRLPRERTLLEEVPGVGRYTAGAILSLAFGQREAAIDANVSRVLARVDAASDPASSAGRARIRARAEALVGCSRPGDVNEALMDLGATVCTAREARCGRCPLARACSARAAGDPVRIAGPRVRPVPRRVRLACAVVQDGDRVLFLRRPDDDRLLAGMWDLPAVEVAVGEDEAAALSRLAGLVRRRTGRTLRVGEPLARVRHEIVGRRIVATAYAAEMVVGGRLPRGARMLSDRQRPGVAVPALPVKILRALPPRGPRRSRAVREEG